MRRFNGVYKQLVFVYSPTNQALPLLHLVIKMITFVPITNTNYMASGITVKVAMRPLFVEYLQSIYYSDNNTVALQHNELGLLVKELLCKTPPDYKPKQYAQGEHATMVLPFYKDLDIHYNNYLSPNSEKIIMRWVHNKFYFDLRNHIEHCITNYNFEIKEGINHFCDIHNINPDNYKNNSLYRDYYRYQQNKKTAKKLRKMSSTFAAFLSFSLPLLVHTLSFTL